MLLFRLASFGAVHQAQYRRGNGIEASGVPEDAYQHGSPPTLGPPLRRSPSVRALPKKCQSDGLTPDELDRNVDRMRTDLTDLKHSSITGEWEETINDDLKETGRGEEDGGGHSCFGVEMWTRITGRPKRNVSVLRKFLSIREDVVNRLENLFEDRMCIDTLLLQSLRPIASPSTSFSGSDIRTCHSVIGPDFEFREFADAYKDFIRSNDVTGQSIRSNLQTALERPEWIPIVVASARGIVATPYSCDVERLISTYNRIKTTDRSSLLPETVNDYLHVIINMPAVAEFNVWPAVQLWLNEERREVKIPPQKNSEWFAGVFQEATESDEASDIFTVHF